MKRIAILDTETTGLDPEHDATVEVAVCLYDLERATPIESYASLIRSGHNEAQAVNAIPVEALFTAPHPDAVWMHVGGIVSRCDAIVAHRAEFDRGFVPAHLRTMRPWVCSKFHIEWPKALRPGDGLVALALAHGVGVSHAHRAMTDVDILSRLFSRVAEMGADLQAMMTKAMRPRGRFIARVSYDDRELAKAAGFQWDGARKEWWKDIALEDVGALPFPTTRTEAA